MFKVRNIIGKYDILKFEEEKIALIWNKTEGILEMTPQQRELEARHLKAFKMRIKKGIEKEN